MFKSKTPKKLNPAKKSSISDAMIKMISVDKLRKQRTTLITVLSAWGRSI